MVINPFDFTHFIPILERDLKVIDISTYEKFKKRYTPMFDNVDEKELFALYCYYYGRSVQKTMTNAEKTGMCIVFYYIIIIILFLLQSKLRNHAAISWRYPGKVGMDISWS